MMAPMHGIPRTVLIPLLACLSVLGACKRSSEKTGDQSGEQVQVTGDQVSIRTEGGSIAVGGNATIPSDFPKVVPIYPGAKVDLAVKSPGASTKGAWALTLETPDDRNKVFTYYKANLSAFRQESDTSAGDTHMGTWQNPQYDVSITIAEAPSKATSITMGVNAK